MDTSDVISLFFINYKDMKNNLVLQKIYALIWGTPKNYRVNYLNKQEIRLENHYDVIEGWGK